MEQGKPAADHPSPFANRDAGIFYPVGYLVAAFATTSDAQRVQQDLTTGGYEAADCELLTSEQVVEGASRNLAGNTGWLSRLGSSDEAVQKHLDAAKGGASFLLIYAPHDTDAQRAMNVVRRVPFRFVHRYHRLAIEDLE